VAEAGAIAPLDITATSSETQPACALEEPPPLSTGAAAPSFPPPPGAAESTTNGAAANRVAARALRTRCDAAAILFSLPSSGSTSTLFRTLERTWSGGGQTKFGLSTLS
jgi:hypothetical protein